MQSVLDNFPEVQHVYKHYPLSDGSRYLAEVAEAVSLHEGEASSGKFTKNSSPPTRADGTKKKRSVLFKRS